MDGKPLTPKQDLFCLEYLKDLNATQAAIRAGYSEKTSRVIGCQNLIKLNIQDRIQELFSERQKRVQVDSDYVLSQAQKLHERCMQEIRPVRTQKGEQVVDIDGNLLFTFDSNGAARSLELIGKHVNVGAFRERIEHTGEDGGPIAITGVNIKFVSSEKGNSKEKKDDS